MKNEPLVSVLVAMALLSACSSDGPANPATAGAGAFPAAGAGSSDGGSSATAGAIGLGGTGTAGSMPNGGASGRPTGGAAGSSGAVNGDAAGGSSGGTAGSSGGTAGSSSSGGTAGSSSGGGTAGSSSGGTAGAGSDRWVGTWTASPYLVASGDQPPSALTNSVLRQVAHVSLGGSQIRVQFSNLSGNGAVNIKSAHAAICKATPAVDSTIDTATDKALAFAGMASVTITAGQEVWSDPIDFAVGALGNVSITTAFGSVPSDLTGHAGARTTSYLQANSSNVSLATLSSAAKTDHWYYLSGIDVMANASAQGAVAIGDSITDGRGTDTNKNNRWTDILAARLQANAGTKNVSMMNQGIGATNLIGSTGTAAEARFARDVLGQSGVKYAIVYDGVNDIGGGASFAAMKDVYDKLIVAAHDKGLLIYAGTILPFGDNGYYTAPHESVRQQVNTYLKSGVFDGYIDFDAGLTDGGTPPKLQAAYAAWSQQDGLHPGPAGYKKMGDTPVLTLFAK
ncbi:MAG: GDSL-type esterase/lipase family protein [Polyangiaceae bacterium]